MLTAVFRSNTMGDQFTGGGDVSVGIIDLLISRSTLNTIERFGRVGVTFCDTSVEETKSTIGWESKGKIISVHIER